MEWHIETDNEACATGFAVVRDSDAWLESCHADEASAMAHLGALAEAEQADEALALEAIADEVAPELVEAIERAFPSNTHPRSLTVQRETRSGQIELRREADGTATAFGYASTFDDPYTVTDFLGEYQETVRAGAFAKTLTNADVRFYVNHEGVSLARTSAGNLDIHEDSVGLAYEARLDTRVSAVNDLALLMESGVMRESSFAFQPIKQTWNADYTKRDLTELRLFDVSVVSTPANPNATAGIRALEGLVSELRQGKVLSATNESLIRDVVAQLDALLTSLNKSEANSRDASATITQHEALIEVIRLQASR